MADNDQERTEEATSFRREEFRKKGQVAQTKELAVVFSLFSVALMMWLAGKLFILQSQKIMTLGLTGFVTGLRSGMPMGDMMRLMTFEGAKVLVPILVLLGIMAVLSSVAQVGFLTNEEAFNPSLDRLDPLQGLKRVFSLKSLIEGIKSVIKIAVIGLVMYSAVKGDLKVIPHLGDYSSADLLYYLGKAVCKILVSIGFVLLVLAGMDYFFQRWDLEKQMRMTKQEVKEEVKSREGDPLIKARIRRIQREMANKRMMEAIPKADVVITNPTHLAVVLKYDPEKFAAPQLVAKGADLVAQKIRELAKEHGVPIVENKPLARTIFKTLKIGQTIPRELFQAVAQVLSYVFKLKKRKVRS